MTVNLENIDPFAVPIDIAMPAPILDENRPGEVEMVEYLGVMLSRAVMEALIEQQRKVQG